MRPDSGVSANFGQSGSFRWGWFRSGKPNTQAYQKLTCKIAIS